MRKHCRRRARESAAPMLAVLLGVPEVGISERLAVDALASNWAHPDHFDRLAECRDLLMLAASEKNDRETLEACQRGFVALTEIKARHARIGKLGATGEELKALRALVDQSEDFWSRQNGVLFKRHYDALKRARNCKTPERA